MGNESLLRLGAFAAAVILFAILETLLPDRRRTLTRWQRWQGAILMMGLGGLASRLVLPVGLAGAALWADARGWGLLSLVDWPIWLEVIIAMVVLDFAIWAQHVATHIVPPLWRLHRVHHADPEVDVSTAFRFHPFEIGLSALWKAAVVVVLGAPAVAAFWYEVLLNSMAQFNHANMKLPRWLDRSLRLIVVTPGMHRVHHSVKREESDNNYGNFLSIWDRIFGVYTPDFSDGPDAVIGQDRWRSAEDQRLDKLLLQPVEKT